MDEVEYKTIFSASLVSGAYSESNPDGVIPLCVAENKLTSDLVAERLARVPPIPKSFLGYGGTCFSEMAKFVEKFVTKRPISPQEVVVTCGASGAIDQLTFMLCDADDKVIVTAPGYQGFEVDVCTRNGVLLEFAHLNEDKEFRIDVDVLEETWNKAGGALSRIRAVLISTPGNPTGEVLTAETILEIVEWTRARGLHAIFDEIYALSVFAKGSKFVSVAEVLDHELGDDVHIVWALSKDFCASGLRAGLIVTQNKKLWDRLMTLFLFGGLSSLTGWALIDIFADTDWVESYIAENKRRLGSAYANVTKHMESSDIPYMPAEAGFFLIVDLRRYLEGPPSRESEMALFRKMADAGVILTPCCEAFSTSYGFFRLVYGAVTEDEMDVVWKRLKPVLTHE